MKPFLTPSSLTAAPPQANRCAKPDQQETTGALCRVLPMKPFLTPSSLTAAPPQANRCAKPGRVLPMQRFRIICSLTVVALLAAPLSAETLQQAGQRLIRQCLAAVGGQAYSNMQNKVQHGRAYQFYEGRLSGLTVMTTYIEYEPKPASPPPGWIGIRDRRDIGKKGGYHVLFMGGQGWEITFRGARPFPEDYMRQYRERLRRDIFYILKYRIDEPGMIFESLGTDIIQNQPADTLRITDSDNQQVTVYLLQLTHLPIHAKYERRDPKTREVFEEVTNWSKYRTVSGVQLPYYTQLVRDGEKIYEMFGDDLEINKDLPESLFELKKGVKVLPED
jgi:hypothetical protein